MTGDSNVMDIVFVSPNGAKVVSLSIGIVYLTNMLSTPDATSLSLIYIEATVSSPTILNNVINTYVIKIFVFKYRGVIIIHDCQNISPLQSRAMYVLLIKSSGISNSDV